MNINTCEFVTLPRDSNIREYKIDRNLYEYSDNGVSVYQIGIPIPVIVKSYGCIGMAIPRKFKVDETLTTVTFTFKPFDTNNSQEKYFAKAYYSLYRGKLSADADDSADVDDVLIPGAMQIPTKPRKINNRYDDRDDSDDEFDRIMGMMRGNPYHGNPDLDD